MKYDDTIRWQLEIDKKDIAYIVGIFDAYDNLAVVRTLESARGLIELLIAPDFLEDTRKLVAGLAKEIPLRVLT